MHRIDSAGAVDGKWQSGNPAVGQRATQIPADWMNAVQEELCHVVEASGVDLDKGNTTQLYAAIIALIAGVVGDGSGAVPTVRRVDTSGLASGGGDLAANRTVNVAKASQAEVAAQVRDDVAVTPYGMAGLVSLSAIGGAWIIRVGPVLIQLFDATAQANSTTIINLPQAYIENHRCAFANGGSQGPSTSQNGPFVNGRGLSTVSVFSALDEAYGVQIMTIGR